MAKTKDWGPEFQRVADLFAAKSKAYRAHETAAAAEVAAHDGSHAYGRHGYQTGWEAQLIRAVTTVSPDQEFDPLGLNPTVRRWNLHNVSSSAYGAHGETVETSLFDETAFDPAPSDYGTVAGKASGAFLSPEAQIRALNKATEVISGLSTPLHDGAVWRFVPRPSAANRFAAPMTSVAVVVPSARDGEPLGVGFAQQDPKTYRKESRETVIRCIEGFQARKKWSEIYPKADLHVRKFNRVVLDRNKVAFPQITDLFEYFDVDVTWQTSAIVVFRRTYTPPSTLSAWRVVTMFPDDAAPGWAPSLFLTPAWKQTLKARGMNANKDDYAWTGRTCNIGKTQYLDFPVPGWA